MIFSCSRLSYLPFEPELDFSLAIGAIQRNRNKGLGESWYLVGNWVMLSE